MTWFENFDIRPERGFLPDLDPLERLPQTFAAWDEFAYALPKGLLSDRFRHAVDALPKFEVAHLKNEQQYRRAMLVLSYIGHAYVWVGKDVATKIPANLAQAWYEVAQFLGRPPILSYASYALDNWRRINPDRGIELGNIALLQNFFGGVDEEWFILVHVDIEARAWPAIEGIFNALNAVKENDLDALELSLERVASSLSQVYQSLARMPEYCDPYVYYNRVRPYIHGWKDNPAMPEGLLYEGVEAYQGKPQKFRGETGAQSSIIPALDALLGVVHQVDPLLKHLQEMRQYMPIKHRNFIEFVETGPGVRSCVQANSKSRNGLRVHYNECVTWIERFRSRHLEYAIAYIDKQHQVSDANPTKVGTGGTPFINYLKKHRDETADHLI